MNQGVIYSEEIMKVDKKEEDEGMAKRPVYVTKMEAPFYSAEMIEFDWNGGFAKSQKQKNITAIHTGFKRRHPDKEVLEISSKSMQEYGEALSAFFLKKYVPDLGESIPVECVFQAGKVFEKGGPYQDIMEKTPREAKRDERLRNSGVLVSFWFDGKTFPLIPRTVFYDYIYINALFENPELAAEVMKYDAFTDIEFNPDKSINCQAKAAATFVALTKLGLIDKARNFDTFVALYNQKQIKTRTATAKAAQSEKIEKFPANVEMKPGNLILHRKFGEGKIKAVTGTTLIIDYSSVGQKTLDKAWCEKNCKIIKEEQELLCG